MTKKCICQICCCGRHRCPHNPNHVSRVINKSKLDNCHVTEYGGKFQQTQVSRGPFDRPRDMLVPEGNQDHQTMHRTNFLPFKVEVQHIRKVEEYHPNTESMELDTEYKRMYVGNTTKPAKMPAYLKKTTQRLPSGKISGETVHKNEFRPWEVQRPKKEQKTQAQISRYEPFTDNSIHRTDFVNFKAGKPPIFHQPDMIKLEGDYSLETSNRHDYKAYETQAEFVKHCNKQETYHPISEPFAGNSLIKEDFPAHGLIPKTQIFKPISTALKSNSPIEYHTTHKSEYKNWERNRRYERPQEVYMPPSGMLDLKTTSSDYRCFGPEGKAAKSARPKTILRTGRDGEFDGTSNYNETFKAWKIMPSRPFRLQDELRRSAPAALKFNETSEHREKFKPHSIAPAAISKHRSTLFQTEDKLDDVSQYKKDFKGEAITSCPSHALLKLGELSGVVFEQDNDTGHRFVVSKQSSNTALPPIEGASTALSLVS